MHVLYFAGAITFEVEQLTTTTGSEASVLYVRAG